MTQGYPVFNSKGYITGAIEVRRNITEQKLAQENILRAKKESSFLSSRRGVLNESNNVAIVLMRSPRGDNIEGIGSRFGHIQLQIREQCH